VGKNQQLQTEKIIHHFVVDVNADQASKPLELNRNTIDQYYLIFRVAIVL